MMTRLLMAAASALALAGCAVTQNNANSLTLPAAIVNISSAPLSGNLKGDFDLSQLKKGESDEVMFLWWPYPPVIVTIGDETIKSAMKKGGINELCFADYTIKHYLIISHLTVRAYGR